MVLTKCRVRARAGKEWRSKQINKRRLAHTATLHTLISPVGDASHVSFSFPPLSHIAQVGSALKRPAANWAVILCCSEMIRPLLDGLRQLQSAAGNGLGCSRPCERTFPAVLTWLWVSARRHSARPFLQIGHAMTLLSPRMAICLPS